MVEVGFVCGLEGVLRTAVEAETEGDGGIGAATEVKSTGLIESES